MQYLISPFIQVVDTNGKPIAGARIYVYEADTTTSVVTYQNFDGGLNTDPVLTDELGNCTILVDDECGQCDVIIKDENDNLLIGKKYVTPGVEGGGSSTQTYIESGYGIIVTESVPNVFKVAVYTDILATKDDLMNYQEKLSGGNNIEITPSNVVNVTGRKSIYTVDPLYTLEDTSAIYFGCNTSSFVTSSNLNDYLTTEQYSTDSATFLRQSDLNDYVTNPVLYATSSRLSDEIDNKLDISSYSPVINYDAWNTNKTNLYTASTAKMDSQYINGNYTYKEMIGTVLVDVSGYGYIAVCPYSGMDDLNDLYKGQTVNMKVTGNGTYTIPFHFEANDVSSIVAVGIKGDDTISTAQITYCMTQCR